VLTPILTLCLQLIVDENKFHFRVRVNDEELIGLEVPHFSSNGNKYIVDLLFVSIYHRVYVLLF
jgi:hypothetical protein